MNRELVGPGRKRESHVASLELSQAPPDNQYIGDGIVHHHKDWLSERPPDDW